MFFLKNENKVVIQGVVQSGQGLGKSLNAATANLDISLGVGLKEGLYQCAIFWKKRIMKGLLFYGMNFSSKQKCLEVHIIDFNEMIAGQEIMVEVGKFLRKPIKFQNSEEAKKIIANDLEQARNVE